MVVVAAEVRWGAGATVWPAVGGAADVVVGTRPDPLGWESIAIEAGRNETEREQEFKESSSLDTTQQLQAYNRCTCSIQRMRRPWHVPSPRVRVPAGGRAGHSNGCH